MQSDKTLVNSINLSPKIENHLATKIQKKSKILSFKKEIYNTNPSENSFNKFSTFIYRPIFCSIFYQKYSNKNKIKPTSDDISLLKKKIFEIENAENTINPKDQIILSPELSSKINAINIVPPILYPKEQKISDILKNLKTKDLISVRKITNLLKTEYNEKISKSSTYNILKNKLNLRYLKTVPKSKNLESKSSIKMTFYFLKIIIRGIKMGMDFIFIDESGFAIKNENFRIWRSPEEEIFYDSKENKKLNLILAVSTKKVLLYELSYDNINANKFLNFMEKLCGNLSENEKNNSIIIMDNFTGHLTMELLEFYKKKGLKILFNVPLLSTFNMIELCFRFLKNIIYKHLYKDIKEVENHLIELFKENHLEKKLILFFKETLNKYLKFIETHNYINLNN